MAVYLLLPVHLVLIFGSTHGSNVYIVYMGEKEPDIEPDLVQETHHGILASVLGSSKEAKRSIIYSYKYSFSGFSAVLSPSQATSLADIPGVVRVLPNRILNLHTTRSWDFMHLGPTIPDGPLSIANPGQSSIIGILDTGIWPESESFRDDGMGEIPSRWKGKCVEGENFTMSNCNRKIIGAKWYIKGYEAENGKLNKTTTMEFLSSRDVAGHGTHTSSTAAGSPVTSASFLNLASGIARGGASGAHLAVYKILADKRMNPAAHANRKANEPQPLPQRRKRFNSPTEFLERFQKCSGLVASGVANNMSKVGSYVKESIDDILYPYRKPPK